MQKYHIRRSDKQITSQDELEKIIERQEYLTIALCKENIPYLVSLNYGFDSENGCFYFHCANEGRKITFMRSNPNVYGQILEELKYKEGRCSYAYRSVQFNGTVIFLKDWQEKKHALTLMIEKLENPNLVTSTKEKFLTGTAVEKVLIGKIIVQNFTGKEERL